MRVSWNRTEGDFEEKSSFEDIVCYIFLFDRWCAMIYVSFIEVNLVVLRFWERLYIIAYSQVVGFI